MVPDQRIAYEKEEEEADESGSLWFCKETANVWAYFQGIINTLDGTKGELLEFLNLMWVKHHFHKKFVVSMVAIATNFHAWVTVPVGSLRSGKYAHPPSWQ